MPARIQPPGQPWEYAPTTWPDGPFDTDDPRVLAILEATSRAVRQLQARRDAEYLSRAALAKRAGLSAHAVGNIEAGRSWPSFVALAAIADAMRADWTLEPRDRRP